MRIAQIAPLAEAVPPRFYGGTERVVSWLTEELVAMGHDVSLYASGDSHTSARLVPCAQEGLRLQGISDHLSATVAMLERVMRDAERFDVLHFHTDFVHFPPFRPLSGRCFTTLHGRLDMPGTPPAFRAFRDMKLVSISDNQRTPIADCNFVATVYHGLPEQLIPFSSTGGEYLAFLGRMSPEKRPDRAIEIAKRVGMPLRMAAKIDPADRDYFDEVVAPLLDHPLIEFVGEIGEADKPAFLGNARALLFPIDWPEPFGLVMIEAMAAGTPTIAWPAGSAPEVIDHGRSGFLVDSIEAAVAAVASCAELPRAGVRQCFEQRFTARRMAMDYERLYTTAVAGNGNEADQPVLLANGQ